MPDRDGTRRRYEDLIGRAERHRIGNATVAVASIHDVIASKQWANRPKDRQRYSNSMTSPNSDDQRPSPARPRSTSTPSNSQRSTRTGNLAMRRIDMLPVRVPVGVAVSLPSGEGLGEVFDEGLSGWFGEPVERTGFDRGGVRGER